ncbi:hypothetical protein GCM10007989_37520 [Devosia pacifica]|uniref:DUF1192 domain-containing protein n=1 Tax=Devosia pacifica TaxID=1335967 RepID=A0A918VX69_9HYPH|nr:DUF1192 domain-containing protein [Devosia pacifica]GHA38092.1 hypothetical protein GCM10007989_37520 [Devosia pacifica]
MFEDDTPRKSALHEVGMPLDVLSVEELQQRIVILEQEIDRLRKAIDAKGETRTAADNVFKF